jgi:DNA-binding GntR family transcriptional regulator
MFMSRETHVTDRSDQDEGLPLGDALGATQRLRAYEAILRDIIICRLTPGARLDETALAERYDAGLASIRDALGRLALEGLVVRRKRSGTTVSSLDLEEIRQAFEARGLIEPHCTALAAMNATSAEIAFLSRALEEAEAAATRGDLPSLVIAKQRLRWGVGVASHNATLAGMLLPLQLKTARFWIYSMSHNRLEERLTEIRHHRTVVEAIGQRNPARASAAIGALLALFPEDIKRALSSDRVPWAGSAQMAAMDA